MGIGFGDWVITEQFGGPMGDHGGDGGVTRNGLRYRLLSPTSSIVEEDEVIVNNKFSILPSSIAAPLIWDMDEGSRAMKGPRRYSGAVGTKLEDFIQEFDSWCDMQMLRNAKLFSPFLAWKGLFQHLEGPSMDDYHEFWRDHATEIESGSSIGLHPMYLLFTVVLLVVVLLHHLLLVRAHRLFPHLHLTMSRSSF